MVVVAVVVVVVVDVVVSLHSYSGHGQPSFLGLSKLRIILTLIVNVLVFDKVQYSLQGTSKPFNARLIKKALKIFKKLKGFSIKP